MDFIDPVEKRLAHTRLCYAMKTQAALLAMIAMDYWDDHADRAKAAWNDILGDPEGGRVHRKPLPRAGSPVAAKIDCATSANANANSIP